MQLKEVTNGFHRLSHSRPHRRGDVKAILPGRQGGGWIATLILGVIGALVGGWLGGLIFGAEMNAFFSLST